MRYLIKFSYDGSNFFGYQKQINQRTIQGELEGVLNIISKEDVSVNSSGRTDALVHAINQYAHFDLNLNIEPLNLKKGMNSLLPSDIYIKDVKIVDDDFHARFNVISKEYIYKINIGEYDPLMRNYIYQYNKDLNIEKMEEAILVFKGKHNFKSFVKTNIEIEDYDREIYDVNISLENSILSIYFKGNGFLRYMVRNMVGALIEVGEGKKTIKDIENILLLEDRSQAGKTAPAQGLYLNNVYYEKYD